MALRVTARLAQRLGIKAPIQGSRTTNRALDPSDPGPGSTGAARGASSSMRCNAKCAVLETIVRPAITAWNCARVFSRCTWRAGGLDSQALAALGAACVDD